MGVEVRQKRVDLWLTKGERSDKVAPNPRPLFAVIHQNVLAPSPGYDGPLTLHQRALVLDNSIDEAYIPSLMPENDSEFRKDFAREVAKAMVSAVLAASSRIDTFSTWLMGITTGFLVLLFTNIERTIHAIKIRPVKALIVILLVDRDGAVPEVAGPATPDRSRCSRSQ